MVWTRGYLKIYDLCQVCKIYGEDIKMARITQVAIRAIKLTGNRVRTEPLRCSYYRSVVIEPAECPA